MMEKPRLPGPKPAIASKPKFVPPVRTQRLIKEEGKKVESAPPRTSSESRVYSTHVESFKPAPSYKKVEELIKAPNSPSTVCCSILSNTTNDCCGIISLNKKDFCNKMTKLDSVDSTSSDSGGFKDFLQLESDEKKPTIEERKGYVANAQALAQFLPQTEQKILQHKMEREKGGSLVKEEVRRVRPLAHGQFQQSSRKLEELLSQRLEKEKVMRRGCVSEGGSSQDIEEKMMVQKQIQQKLQGDLQQTMKQIQEIQSIELRLPQNRKWSEVR